LILQFAFISLKILKKKKKLIIYSNSRTRIGCAVNTTTSRLAFCGGGRNAAGMPAHLIPIRFHIEIFAKAWPDLFNRSRAVKVPYENRKIISAFAYQFNHLYTA